MVQSSLFPSRKPPNVRTNGMYQTQLIAHISVESSLSQVDTYHTAINSHILYNMEMNMHRVYFYSIWFDSIDCRFMVNLISLIVDFFSTPRRPSSNERPSIIKMSDDLKFEHWGMFDQTVPAPRWRMVSVVYSNAYCIQLVGRTLPICGINSMTLPKKLGERELETFICSIQYIQKRVEDRG